MDEEELEQGETLPDEAVEFWDLFWNFETAGDTVMFANVNPIAMFIGLAVFFGGLLFALYQAEQHKKRRYAEMARVMEENLARNAVWAERIADLPEDERKAVVAEELARRAAQKQAERAAMTWWQRLNQPRKSIR